MVVGRGVSICRYLYKKQDIGYLSDIWSYSSLHCLRAKWVSCGDDVQMCDNAIIPIVSPQCDGEQHTTYLHSSPTLHPPLSTQHPLCPPEVDAYLKMTFPGCSMKGSTSTRASRSRYSTRRHLSFSSTLSAGVGHKYHLTSAHCRPVLQASSLHHCNQSYHRGMMPSWHCWPKESTFSLFPDKMQCGDL